MMIGMNNCCLNTNKIIQFLGYILHPFHDINGEKLLICRIDKSSFQDYKDDSGIMYVHDVYIRIIILLKICPKSCMNYDWHFHFHAKQDAKMLKLLESGYRKLFL